MILIKLMLKGLPRRRRQVEAGVTLAELLVVVSILSMLMALGLVYLRTQVFKGIDARKKAEMRRIGIAVEEYEKDNDCYPLPSQVVCSPGVGLQPYMDKIPCDPETNTSYLYVHEDSSCPTWYKFYTDLINDKDADYVAGLGPGGEFSFVYGSSNAPVDSVAGGGGGPPANFYGCFSGSCNPIGWDNLKPGPECDPSFQSSTCYGACLDSGGAPINDCQ
jgi:prepilin-type N-terminal cleavage/methylation domain-containing protein